MLAFAAATGYTLSVLLHLLIRLHIHQHANPEFESYFTALFIGIFLVWFPTVLYMQRFSREMRGFSFRGWKYIVAGAPAWLIWLAGLSFVYAFVNFALVTQMGAAQACSSEET